MQVFARVVETGSFTRAAESLNLPKGSVTKLVQQLEERLKVRLLNRTTRQVTVTADGAAYYERTSRLLNDLDDIEASMSNAQANPSGRLRVDVGTSVARLILIPALPDFYRRYPDIQIDLGVTDRPVDLISDNVDCVIRGGELVEQSLVARRVGNMQLVTVATPAYLRERGMPRHPSELESGGHTTVNFFSSRTVASRMGWPRPARCCASTRPGTCSDTRAASWPSWHTACARPWPRTGSSRSSRCTTRRGAS